MMNRIYQLRKKRFKQHEDHEFGMHSSCDWCGGLMDSSEVGIVSGVCADVFKIPMAEIERAYPFGYERICNKCKDFIRNSIL